MSNDRTPSNDNPNPEATPSEEIPKNLTVAEERDLLVKKFGRES